MGIREVGFGMDEFNKPKVLSVVESIKQIVMNVLTCKPGNIPSMPSVGVDIRRYVEYVNPEDVDKQALQNLIKSQLSTVLPYDQVGDVLVVQTTLDGQPTLVISIPIEADTEEDPTKIMVAAGFSINTSKELLTGIEAQLVA